MSKPLDPKENPIAQQIGYLITQDALEGKDRPQATILISVQADGQLQRIYYGNRDTVLLALKLTERMHIDEMLDESRGKPKDPNRFFEVN